jgi:hypothetical protein
MISMSDELVYCPGLLVLDLGMRSVIRQWSALKVGADS